MTIHTPFAAHLLTPDIQANARRTRTFAQMIDDLGAEHDAHVARVAEIEAQYQAWSARIDGLVSDWEAHNGCR